VRDVMSDGIRYCFEDQTVEEAAELMSQAQIRRLPVLNRDKRGGGLGALGDLATETPAGGEALSRISQS
jgi:CBS domain-containing protein